MNAVWILIGIIWLWIAYSAITDEIKRRTNRRNR